MSEALPVPQTNGSEEAQEERAIGKLVRKHPKMVFSVGGLLFLLGVFGGRPFLDFVLKSSGMVSTSSPPPPASPIFGPAIPEVAEVKRRLDTMDLLKDERQKTEDIRWGNVETRMNGFEKNQERALGKLDKIETLLLSRQ